MSKLKWPRRLVIIRHGESEQNAALDLFQDDLNEVIERQSEIREADIKLSERGIEQSKETGKYLATTEKFDKCFSSPYRRAVKTAEHIINNIGYDLDIYKDFRIREKEFGKLHGLTAEAVKENYPVEFKHRKRDGKFYYRLPRGENYLDVGERVHSFLDKLHRNYPGKSILVVCHQVPYLMFRSLFEHLGEKEVLALGDVPNCGIQEYLIDTSEYEEGRMKLNQYNYVAYDEDLLPEKKVKRKLK